ncbi:glycerophosphodiester phosphodiesterase [Breznakiella homolactica]|uniref:Glycerophosphodiester phosphodiesterase n=1 Tax=Breznakiella homolactica TaxID=2798577 RepID=A0A7T7XPD1_9SPIR|nr:glycerophosphodiester phosphodiesterase [Breznakiella homolactica]QQO10031.1 glycerophosphodiester phosphodiesterase [Breznakiella homolactica]
MSIPVYHRGGGRSLGYPPNSLLTIQWAVGYGAQAIEYDVAYCEDRRIVLIEPRLLKEHNLDIDNLSWPELEKINTGNEKYGPCRAASFKEIQEIIPGHIFQQIHIKGNNKETVHTLPEKLSALKNYILTSFDLEMIREIKEHNSGIPVGWIVKPEQEDGSEGTADLTALVSANPDALPNYSEDEIDGILEKAASRNVTAILLCGPRIKAKEIIEKVKATGFICGAWGTGQNLGTAKRLMSYGIDTFTIDNPEELDSG